MTNKSKMRILTLLVAAALILASLPAAALAESFSAAVKSRNMKVYADEQGQNYLGALSRKTIVTVESYSGGVAKINYKGASGYALVSDMVKVDSFAEKAVTNCATRVYQKASTASPYANVGSGVTVYVLAARGGVAMVERGGNVGYMLEKHLTYANASLNDNIGGFGNSSTGNLEDLKDALESEANKQEEKEEVSKPESIADAFSSGKYSNEQLCYMFAVKVMGYNEAAACGLLANIAAESNFRTNANGDSGKSYGICQWYSSRKSRLLNWCDKNSLDPSTLLAQLYFLKYELETYYPSVHRYMKGVSNDAQGAYDAAYYFCYNFEAPANKASKSNSRGNTAKNTYYPKYA